MASNAHGMTGLIYCRMMAASWINDENHQPNRKNLVFTVTSQQQKRKVNQQKDRSTIIINIIKSNIFDVFFTA